MLRVRNWRRLAIIFVAVAVFGSGLYWAAANVVIPLFFPGFGMSEALQDKDGDGLPDGRMNMLVLGVDARDGETITRSDTIMFVSAEPREHRVSILSIPRDTRVEIPGHGWDKINAASALGGPKLAQETVSQLLDVPIDYYVMTNFEGFKKLVDILGGVTLEVEKNMRHNESDGYPINLQKGVQKLDGEKALQYVRYRGYAMGDITRAEAQQKFLKALAQEMVKTRHITKLPKLVPQLRDCIETNMGTREMARWAGVARKMDDVQMVASTLPGYPLDINGGSYWYVDPERARQAVAQVMDGVALASNIETPPPGTETPATKPKPEPEQDEQPVEVPQGNLPPAEQTPGEPAEQEPEETGSGGVEVIITPESPADETPTTPPPADGGGESAVPPQSGDGGDLTLPPL